MDLIYQKINADKFTFDLKLKVPYAMSTIPMAPSKLSQAVRGHCRGNMCGAEAIEGSLLVGSKRM